MLSHLRRSAVKPLVPLHEARKRLAISVQSRCIESLGFPTQACDGGETPSAPTLCKIVATIGPASEQFEPLQKVSETSSFPMASMVRINDVIPNVGSHCCHAMCMISASEQAYV